MELVQDNNKFDKNCNVCEDDDGKIVSFVTSWIDTKELVIIQDEDVNGHDIGGSSRIITDNDVILHHMVRSRINTMM